MSHKYSKSDLYETRQVNRIRKHNPGLRALLAFWSRYCDLSPWHAQWAHQHIDVMRIPRGEVLSWSGDRTKKVYFVCKGMLGRIIDIEVNGIAKRKIMSIALPGLALTSTTHLYRNTPHEGDIVALRSGIVVGISYKAIKAFKAEEPAIETLVDILTHKKKRQLEAHIQILHSTSPFERYLLFDKLMPEIRQVTSQREQADFLGISRDTVQKAQKFLLMSKAHLK
ncbi:hypothetical protein C5749_16980 [Sphingobacterium gobiense]|uniref:Crp/Fnr family transcriptional regulator n=2 Tax=Sphingobacterium gobiense TaxID=1382456 RepID=A0A2S9JGN2_9SPHI|nr:hypothetical protein C5749_16980 [Sphingobacterium gobiense]